MTARFLFALCTSIVPLWLSWVRPVHAESVLFASSEARTAELLPELTLALRGHGVLLLVRGLGDARTPLERAAAAQRIGRNLGTWAALWVEREPPLRVRAVEASGERIYEAPLPAPMESVEPRVFASVASSVLLEALGRASSADVTPASGSVEALRGAAVNEPAGTVPPWAGTGSRPPPVDDAVPRFFLRAGLGYGFVYVGEGARSDRQPDGVIDEVAALSRGASGELDLDRARRELQARGYDCQVESFDLRLAISECSVAVNPGGVVGSFALDLALGARLLPRLSLALTLRLAPDAGEGTLAHTVLGLQLEAALAKPRRTGFWLNALAGAGIGRIQVKPPASGSDAGPYAISGPAQLCMGVQLGYRFTPHWGLYTGPVLYVGLPDTLFALQSSLGLEVRL